MNGDINGNINGGIGNNSTIFNASLTMKTENMEELDDDVITKPVQLEPEASIKAPSSNVDQQPEIDVVINNVVCSFSVRCHLNLRDIALHGFNVEYKREQNMVSMKLRKPRITASIWSSGKVTCTGATSEIDAKIGARKIARILQKLGFKTRMHNYRIVNVLGTCTMPFGIKITMFTEQYKEADYEPELHPGVTYKMKHFKATMKIYATGSITITAPSITNVQRAVEHIYPLVYEFRQKRTQQSIKELQQSHYFKNSKCKERLCLPILFKESDANDDAEGQQEVEASTELF